MKTSVTKDRLKPAAALHYILSREVDVSDIFVSFYAVYVVGRAVSRDSPRVSATSSRHTILTGQTLSDHVSDILIQSALVKSNHISQAP